MTAIVETTAYPRPVPDPAVRTSSGLGRGDDVRPHFLLKVGGLARPLASRWAFSRCTGSATTTSCELPRQAVDELRPHWVPHSGIHPTQTELFIAEAKQGVAGTMLADGPYITA
jgi:hypothetical protein